MFPSLNFNADEISCAIGNSVLKKLPKIIKSRLNIVKILKKELQKTKTLTVLEYDDNLVPSFFFCTIIIKKSRLKVSKNLFIKALAAEGIPLNGNYKDILCEWKWLKKSNKFKKIKKSKNAINLRNNSFNLLFNENFSNKDIRMIVESVIKVEKYFCKK